MFNCMDQSPNPGSDGNVKGMSRLDGDDQRAEASTGQRQIAEEVEALVAGQLVLEAERATGAIVRQDDGVVKAAAGAEARRPQRRNPIFEAEGPRGGQLVHKNVERRPAFGCGMSQR